MAVGYMRIEFVLLLENLRTGRALEYFHFLWLDRICRAMSPKMNGQGFQLQELGRADLAFVHDGTVLSRSDVLSGMCQLVLLQRSPVAEPHPAHLALEGLRFAMAVLHVRLQQAVVHERLLAEITFGHGPTGTSLLGGFAVREIGGVQIDDHRFVVVFKLTWNFKLVAVEKIEMRSRILVCRGPGPNVWRRLS